VLRWLPLLAPGSRVLDLACGSGRHALAALAQGHEVLAVDRDAQALAGLARLAERPSGGLAGGRSGTLATCRLDLEQGPWSLPAGSFDAVIVTNYLFRPRFALACGLLAPGGLLIHETFARGNERYGRPANPDFLLGEGELIVRTQAAGLVVCGYESGRVAVPKPAVVQRVCAARPPAGSAKLTLLARDLP
jgi:SAM-dependent methyltransferase